MKKILIASLLLITSTAYGQSPPVVENSAGSAICRTGSTCAIATDTTGKLLTASSGTYCIAVTPTVEAAAYAAGDCFHATAIELALATRGAAGSGRVKSIIVADKQGQAKNMTAVLFNSAPSTICAAINGAFDPADADMLLITAGGPIPISSHDAFSDNGLSFTTALDRSYKLASGTSLYLALLAEEAVTPAVGDYTVTVCVERD